jgi:hypothetical protein
MDDEAAANLFSADPFAVPGQSVSYEASRPSERRRPGERRAHHRRATGTEEEGSGGPRRAPTGVVPRGHVPSPWTSLSCATGRVGCRISQGKPHVEGPGFHSISRSGVSRAGMLCLNAARILACSGPGRATRRRASFRPSVISRTRISDRPMESWADKTR